MAESKATTGSTRASSAPPPHGPPLRFERFELDEANARLMRDGKAVTLAPTPFAVLCALVRKPGALLTKHALLDQVWGHQFVSESVLKTVISELRTVLDDDARRPRFIETVSRRGYRFIAPTFEAASQSWAGAPRIGSLPAPAFIGRADALSRLRSAWDVASTGKRSITWIAGEPGIGKTTLIEHFVAGLGDVACIRGQCVEQYGGGEPYLPVLEALAELCRRDRDAVPLLRAVAPTWLLQLPWLTTAEERDVLRRELAGVRADRTLREMGELLDRYTERRPLLLVTEDLHWSDRATIQLIDYIARRRGSARLMWLASFRLAEVVALDHLLNALRRELRLHRLCEEIVLDPFSEREVAEYVGQSALSIAADEAFVRVLHERTDGLPLFVASVTSEIAARGGQSARQDAAAQIAKIAVPENLAAIIDHYIANLGEEQRMVLSAAAVCGVEFRAGTIAGALERDAAWVSLTCEALVREHLWLAAVRGDEGGRAQELRYAFRHALFREVLYDRTVAATRARLHRKAGAALEQERATGVPVSAGELAVHFERGGEPTSALRYYAEAAEAALLRFSPAECMSLTERGLMLLDKAPQEERKAAEIALATLRGVAATQLLGVGSEAKSALARAYSLLRDVPEHPMRTRLLYAFGFLLCLRGEYAEALTVAQRAEALSSATSDPVLMLAAGLVRGNVDQLQGRWQSARAWAEQGLALAQPRDLMPGETFVADPQVTLLGVLAVPLLHLGLVEQGRAHLERAHARARELGQPMARLAAIWYDALFEVRLGNAERVAALADEMRALVDDFALGVGRNGYRWFRGWADARMGQPLEGYRAIREGYEENSRLGMLSGGSEVLGYAAEALVLKGDWEAAQEQLQEALQLADTLAERVYLPQLHLIGAAIAHGRGDAAAASASLRRALAEARAQDSPWLELLALVDLCEHGGATAKDRRALAALVDRLTEAVGTRALTKAQALLDQTKSDGTATFR